VTLVPVAEAQRRLLALGTPLAVECIASADALGRYLAEPMTARRSQPAADLSAMDGYAIRHADLPGPWRVTGESRAGDGDVVGIGSGEAARISTGAALPYGADTILIQEHARRDGATLILDGDLPEACGQFVRRAGSDFAKGTALGEAGDRIGAAHLGLAALAGRDRVSVRTRPRVALVSTGDEIANALLPDANAPMLAAMLASEAVDLVALGPAGDSVAAIAAVLAKARDCDLIVTTGGVSVGDHDHVRAALESIGGSVDFWRIAMRPGKPLLAGMLGRAVVLGLPGNPVSAYVTAMLFAVPLVRHLAGSSRPLPRIAMTTTATALGANGPRETYARATLGDDGATLLPDQDSAAMRTLARADALIVRAAHAPALDAGDPVAIVPLD
jgi:molybdopterin molybdotransferase